MLRVLRDFILQTVWPGLGLLGESYMLFSLGTLQPLLGMFGLEPMVIPLMIGVIVGMLAFGAMAQTIGRRMGSISTAVLMCMGSIGMCMTSIFLVSSSSNVVLFGVSLCLLGIGVGGEYPMAAASASEQSDRSGRHVQLVFSMQGMGILLHCVLLWVLLLVFGEKELASMLLVWRIVYMIGVVLLLVVLITRVLHLKESPAWEEDQRKAAEMVQLGNDKHTICQSPSSNSTGHQEKHAPTKAEEMEVGYPVVSTVSSLSIPSVALAPEEAVYHIHTEQHATEEQHKWKLAWKLYGSRLMGVSLSWFLWDIAFYGNKLFQSAFLLALTGEETTLTEGAGAATLNAAVAAAGYLTAAAVIDRVGHWRLQFAGFVVTGILFLLTGLFLDVLSGAKTGLVVLYLGSSYFGQVGPNATTFVLPADVIPTAWRTVGHGIAAASGKLGALVATLVFRNSDDTADLFLWSGYASLLGAVATYWFVPCDSNEWNKYEVMDSNWHKAASGQPFVVPADSMYERLSARRQKVHANGNYLTSDFHEAVYE